ncbi:MAG: SAM-dependent methyltransferase [Proteobacteria bacterium]|nr:SAM-dependent methyltransferase [Pseudomonadota bacterium]
MSRSAVPTLEEIRDALQRLFIGAEGCGLRTEDEKKCVEVRAMFAELGRVRKGGLLVDAAAGKAPVGLVAAELLGFERLVVIERDEGRVGACHAAAERLVRRAEVRIREGDVGDPALWPDRPDAAVALHACGPAADRIIDAAVRARARFLLLVPCCYGAEIPFARAAADAVARADLCRHAEIRRRVENALVDAERTLRLEAGGYRVEVVQLVPPTVTPHNLLWRARWAGEPVAMARAARQLEGLVERITR